MKLTKIMGVIVAALVLAVATGAEAKAKNSSSVILRSDVTLAGTHLASGKYQVQWEAQNPKATVTFQQDKKTVARAEGKVVDRGKKFPDTAVICDEQADGTRVIKEIRFQGSSEAIVFAE